MTLYFCYLQTISISLYVKNDYSTYCNYSIQAHRKGGVGGKLPRAPRRLGDTAFGQKYTQNVPFKKMKNFFSDGPLKMFGDSARMFPGPAVAFDGPDSIP